MRRLLLLLCAALLILGFQTSSVPRVYALGDGSANVAPTAWAECPNGICDVEVRQFDVTNRNHVYLATSNVPLTHGFWASTTETITSFTLGGNVDRGYFHWAVDNAGSLWCYQPTGSTGWSIEPDFSGSLDVDARRATPGGNQNPTQAHYVTANFKGTSYDYPTLGNQGQTPCYQGGPGLVNIGGGTLWSPAVTQMSDGAHVVVTGLDNAVWNWANGWQSEGGGSLGSPSAVSWDNNARLDLFIRGQDNALWHRGYQSGTWGPWISHGGNLSSGPGCTSWQPGRLFCAAIGSEGTSLWGIDYDGANWSSWYQIG